MSSLYVVQANPVPGREQEFRDWYDDRHLADVLAIPDYLTARRYERSAVQQHGDAHRYPFLSLAVYELGDVRRALDGLTRALADGMEMSPSLAGDRFSVVYDRVTAHVAEGRAERGARSLLVVQDAAPPEAERAARDDRRLADALALPGLVAASRYVRSGLQREPRAHDSPYRSLTLYEIEGDHDPRAALDVLGALADEPGSAPAGHRRISVLFDLMTERTTP